jgi:hypothetical protein
MNLATFINFRLLAIGSKSTAIAGGPAQVDTNPIDVADQLVWQDGTGADKANKSYQMVGTIANLEVQTFDMTSGLVDAFGDAVSFTRLKAVYLRNTTAAGGSSLLVGGTVSMLPSGMTVRPGESYLRAVGDATAYAVTNNVSDALTIQNATPAMLTTFRLVLVGESA